MAGPAGIQFPLFIVHRITADTTAGSNYTATRAGTIIDVRVLCTATNGGGTVSVSDGVGAATVTAVVMAVVDVATRTVDLDPAHCAIAAGGVINFITNGAADRGDVNVWYLPALSATQVLTP